VAEKRSWIKWVAIGCGGLMLLAVVFGVGLYFMVTSMTAAPEQVARDFCAAAAAGDFARAHDFFAAPLKESQPLDVFTATVEANPSLFRIKDTSFNERSIDLAGTKLGGTATLESGTTVPISFTLVRENDDWKLMGYNIGSRP